MKKNVKTKEKKSQGRRVEFDPDYLFELTVEVYSDQLLKTNPEIRDGKDAVERVLDKYKKKWGEPGNMKRYREHAQIYAGTVRSVLRCLEKRGELPEAAKSE